ncbi:MAG: cytochrome-c peroxidase [Fimbriimonas sp.]
MSCDPLGHDEKAKAQDLLGELYPAIATREPIRPLPTKVSFDPAKVALGKRLFHDKRLSKDDTISCASCHALDKGGTDQLPVSVGVGGAKGGINAPSVLNCAYNFKQFWNGRMETLEDQVNGPTHHPKEMGSNWDQIVGKLGKDPELVKEFQRLYRDTVKPEHVRDAIATFERSLLTPSKFDRFLAGDSNALDAEEKEGYRLFKAFGCASCHQGTAVGGNLFMKLGVMKDYFADRGNPTDADLGRYEVTKREEDRGVFRVPTLRNIGHTAPYFHDGTASTLPQAVEVMAKYQLGRELDPEQLVPIVRFLESLSGTEAPK